MRERPNYNWIEKVVKLPTECSSCNNKINDWERVAYECSINYIVCEKCTQLPSCPWPKTGYYTIIEDYQDDITMTVHKDKESMGYID